VIKIWQLIGGGPLATGAPSHGTTGTMDNPALPLLKIFFKNLINFSININYWVTNIFSIVLCYC